MIAGFLRNLLKYSITYKFKLKVEHSICARYINNTIKLSETPNVNLKCNKQTLSAKVQSRKGNSPDYKIRSPSK